MNFSAYQPNRSLHPAMRVLLAVAGAAAAALLVVFGALVLLALFAVGGVALLVHRWRHRARAMRQPGAHAQHASTGHARVLEGDFVVVDRSTPPER